MSRNYLPSPRFTRSGNARLRLTADKGRQPAMSTIEINISPGGHNAQSTRQPREALPELQRYIMCAINLTMNRSTLGKTQHYTGQVELTMAKRDNTLGWSNYLQSTYKTDILWTVVFSTVLNTTSVPLSFISALSRVSLQLVQPVQSPQASASIESRDNWRLFNRARLKF
jgi:hypothetical protein